VTPEGLPAVVLRRFKIDDAASHLRGEDEVTSRWLSGGVSTVESVISWIQSNEDNWSRGGPRFAFAIETETGDLAGVIEINVDYTHFAGLKPGDANISYGLYPQFRGRGLAASALLAVRDFMTSHGVLRGVIRVERENVDSIRLAERCGYSRTSAIVDDAGIEYMVFVSELEKMRP
jgi:RimJ/RimL family protein N-acetyltransferase